MLALGAPSVHAQNAAAEAADEAAESKTQLDTITVTAQSRTQELQQVPIALTVVTDEQVEKLTATDLSEVAAFVPGLVVDAFDKTQPAFTLRGISTEGFSMGIDRAVGIYVNGIYQTNGGGALLAFNDLARIEVLKGPQGTLFGRNTAAGAIAIVTNEPGPDVEANARVRVGNYGQRYADALLNVPVGEEFAFRASVLSNRSDGWLDDEATGRSYALDRQAGARLAFGGNLAENWKMLLTFDHESIKEPQRLQIGVLPQFSNSTLRAPFPPQRPTFRDPRDVAVFQDVAGGRQTKDYDAGTLAFTGDFGWGTFTSTSAFSESDLAHFEDQDGTNNPFLRLDSGVTQSGRTWYQEFKLAGANELVDWVAGTSFYEERGNQSNIVNSSTNALDTLLFNQGIRQPCGGPLSCIDSSLRASGLVQRFVGIPYNEQIDNTMTSESFAVFADVIWHLGDRFNLTTGIRYTQDEKRFSWFNQPRNAPGIDRVLADLAPFGVLASIPPQLLFFLRNNVVFPNAAGVRVSREGSWDDVSPRLVLDYQFSDDTMAFVSASKGYKAGGNDGVQIGSEYAPEEVRNYELGIKNRFPELRMMLNASVYHYEYSDRQSLMLVPATNPAGIPQYLVQSTDQGADGVDVEWLWKATDELTVNASAAYIDSTYSSGARTASGIDLSGQPTGEPEWSFVAGAAYAWELASGGQLELSAQYAFRGEARCNADSLFQGSCGAYTGFEVGAEQNVTNARLAWTSADYHWGAALFVTNLFDEQYVRSIGGQGLSVLGTPIGTITPPRFWGVEGSYRF